MTAKSVGALDWAPSISVPLAQGLERHQHEPRRRVGGGGGQLSAVAEERVGLGRPGPQSVVTLVSSWVVSGEVWSTQSKVGGS